MTLTLGIDIGGTKVAGGVVDETGTVLAQIRRQTPASDTAKVLSTTIEVIRELSGRYPVAAIGVGAAGWFDVTRSVVLFAPNLAWRNEPLLASITSVVDLPVVLENDGNTAAWAEFTVGAAQGADDSMVLLTVGTGIGGGVIVGGNLVRGANGIAGEPGHTRVVPDGLRCRCGRDGCLEQYASGTALVRFAKAAAVAEPDSAKQLLAMAGGAVDAIDGPMVTTAAQAGDTASLAAFEQVGSWLGPALADMVQVLAPPVLVVGGGVAEAGELLMAPTRRGYRAALARRGDLPVAEVRRAALGNTAGLIGAADLARRSLGAR